MEVQEKKRKLDQPRVALTNLEGVGLGKKREASCVSFMRGPCFMAWNSLFRKEKEFILQHGALK